VRVLLISGSGRPRSHTCALVQLAGRLLSESGTEVRFWDASIECLPVADPQFHADPSRHPDPRVAAFVHIANDADAFVLGSPIYHNSYSGILKNALDHLAIPLVAYKPVGLLGHGGHRSTQAVDHLRVVVRGLWGIATPTHVCTQDEDYEETDGTYVVSATDINARLDRFVRELVAMTIALRALRTC
jgi:azobenzene reductase